MDRQTTLGAMKGKGTGACARKRKLTEDRRRQNREAQRRYSQEHNYLWYYSG